MAASAAAFETCFQEVLTLGNAQVDRQARAATAACRNPHCTAQHASLSFFLSLYCFLYTSKECSTLVTHLPLLPGVAKGHLAHEHILLTPMRENDGAARITGTRLARHTRLLVSDLQR